MIYEEMNQVCLKVRITGLKFVLIIIGSQVLPPPGKQMDNKDGDRSQAACQQPHFGTPSEGLRSAGTCSTVGIQH